MSAFPGLIAAYPAAEALVAPYASVLRRLPHFEQNETLLRNRLLQEFQGLVLNDSGLSICCQAHIGIQNEAQPEVWMNFETSRGLLGAAVIMSAGSFVAWPTASAAFEVPSALAALSRLEFLLTGIEAMWAVSLRPQGLSPAGPGSNVRIELNLRRNDGDVFHRVILAFAADFDHSMPTVNKHRFDDLAQLSKLPLPVLLKVSGPKILLTELSQLEVGDVVWLSGSRLHGQAAQLCVKGTNLEAPGVIDSATRTFVVQGAAETKGGQIGIEKAKEAMNTTLTNTNPSSDEHTEQVSATVRSPHKLLEDLRVGVQFEIANLTLSLDEIGRLTPGYILSLPTLEDSLPVKVTTQDQVIACGRLVSVGEAYGVLIDQIFGK